MKIKLFLLLFFCYTKTFATHQTPDYLIIDKDTLPIYSNPLESYFDNCERPASIAEMTSTACWRGYVATFRLQNDSLFLVNLQHDYKGETIDFNTIFDENTTNQPKFAYWVSHDLMVPSGKLLSYDHMGYGSTYDTETDYSFKNGLFKSQHECQRLALADFKKKGGYCVKCVNLLC
jgi:hypothetical protein